MKKFYNLISFIATIIIAGNVYAASTSEITLPLQFSQNMPSTSITIESRETPLLLDSGNAGSNVTLSDHVLPVGFIAGFLKQSENIDVYDYNTNFNPFNFK